MGMDESAFALEMRDLVSELVRKEVDKVRPKYRYAEVDSFDRNLFTCNVIYPGETLPVPVKMGSIQPMDVGQLVRVEGTPNDRYIADVIGPSYSVHSALKRVIYNDDAGTTTTVSPAWATTLSGSAGQMSNTFDAPPSGSCLLLFDARVAASSGWAEIGLNITDSSGTVIYDSTTSGNGGILQNVTVMSTGAMNILLTGMTPGDLITVQLEFHVSASGVTGSFDSMHVHMLPVT
jgi:hypothetical protein